MWRSLKQSAVKSKIHNKGIRRHYFSESPSSQSGKVALVIAATGAGLASAVVYSKYNSKLKSLFEKNIPYIDEIYKLLPDINESKSITSTASTSGPREFTTPSSLLKEELDFTKASKKSQKFGMESKAREPSSVKNNNLKTVDNDVNKLKRDTAEQIVSSSEKQVSGPAFDERLLTDMVKQLESSCDDTVSAYKEAAKAIKNYINLLFLALKSLGDSDSNSVWEQTYKASDDRLSAVKNAQERASSTKALVEMLKTNARNFAFKDPKHPLVKMCEDTIEKVAHKLADAEIKIKSVENEAITAAKYPEPVDKSKEEFQQKLDDKKAVSESDLNDLIAHAHKKIEQLAKQQVTEKIRLDEALKQQKLKANYAMKAKIEAELEKRNTEIKIAVARKITSLKENFEYELRKLLHLQAAAHLDHVQEILKIHEQELERKYSQDLEEKLLYMKGVMTSEVSGSMARLEKILAFLKDKLELNVESRKAKSLWLSCQSLINKISSDAGNLCPLEEDIASIKLSVDEGNTYVNTVLAGIPSEAIIRGILSSEVLKQRFFDVKKICQKVAMIDENNDSLYRYFLSYLQSYLIVDEVSIHKAELEGKVAVNPSEWDTLDILSRISYSLKTDDLEQAFRYTNQLKGEARVVAKDWMNELRLFLETQIAIKALSVHAVAVDVQAYH